MKFTLHTALATLLLIGSANAADMRMPVKAPPAAPVPVLFTWTGCYIGAHAGGGWGHKKWTDPTDDDFEVTSHDVDGFIAGGQIGCNVQQDRWVFGIEGQASWANIKGDSSVSSPDFGTVNYHSKTDIVGSIAGRIGWTFGQTGQTMLYAKGGLAFARDKHSEVLFNLGGGSVVPSETDEYTRWGWMVGGGLEYALNNNWSIKAEYNFMHLGNKTISLCALDDPTDCFDNRIRQRIHVAKFGINYRFGGFGGPVVARY